MIDKYLQIETLSVVLIGDFNPVIFQPYWLSNKNLIREDEAEKAKIEIMHNEIVRYELGDWLKFEVTRNRCDLKTSKNPYFEPLKDLACGIFRILKETPVKSFGINNMYDLALQNQENYYKFGSKLTPLAYWSTDLNDPKLLQLEIFEERRKDIPNASRRIRITPSGQSISFGITININNHFELNNDSKKADFVSLLESNWDSSFVNSKNIVENLLTKISF